MEIDPTTARDSATSIFGMLVLVMSYFTKRLISKVDDLDKAGSTANLNLEKFKTEVAKEYAKDISVQASLSRLHERIDDIPREVVSLLRGNRDSNN
jgi:hypothetical protein